MYQLPIINLTPFTTFTNLVIIYYIHLFSLAQTLFLVGQFGLAVRHSPDWAGNGISGQQRDFSLNPLQLSFSSKVVVCGHSLVTLSLTINETLKCHGSYITAHLNARVIQVVRVQQQTSILYIYNSLFPLPYLHPSLLPIPK